VKDPTFLHGFVFGTIATFLLFTGVVVFGHLPRQTVPKMNCVCPDSATITQPRSL
jgi:hypothetical protein